MSTQPRDLADVLFSEPYRFDFFQAVRLLERMHPGRVPVGGYADPSAEVVRFHAHNSLAFPASEVVELGRASEPDGSGPAHMVVSFMGLTGPLGALPRHYTELLAGPPSPRTEALGAFLDIFNHRFISLFYRAWEKYRFPIAYERGEGDAFSHYLFCLIGLGTEGLRDRLSFTDEIFLYYGGLLAQRPRSAIALEALLQDYFDVPVRVEQFTGEWFLMNPDTLSQLGGNNCQLGVSTVLWERVFDPQARFRVSVGPLPFARFREFLPNGAAYVPLTELTRFFVGEDLGFEVQPLLAPSEVPSYALGTDDALRLGWSMWLKTEPVGDDVTQPLFQARVAAHADQEVQTR